MREKIVLLDVLLGAVLAASLENKHSNTDFNRISNTIDYSDFQA